MQGKPEEVFSRIDDLKAIHLSAPFFYELRAALIERGLKIPEDIKTAEQLEDYLCR